eukprot:1057748-Pleurochrysis_carterae.AAC.2
MDSKCHQHVFNNMRCFPFGVIPEPNVVVKTAEKDIPPIIPRGKGNAIIVAAGGAVIEFTNTLLVPDLEVSSVASVKQAMVQNKVEVRFGHHLDMLFHKHIKPIPLDAGTINYMCNHSTRQSSSTSAKEHHGVTLMLPREAR